MLSQHLSETIAQLQTRLPIGESFDLIAREFTIQNRRAYWVGVNGMYNAQVMQLILSQLQSASFSADAGIRELEHFISAKISFGQTQLTDCLDAVIRSIVSGPSVLFIDGYAQAVIIDLREYPVRSIAEPDNEKVLKGAKDGFVETLLFNANLIRRRIRNPRLTFALQSVGRDSQTDVAVAYVEGTAEESLVSAVKSALAGIEVGALTVGEKSLEELLVEKHWYHPMPSLRTTERPDVACSCLLEGNVLILVDNTPLVIILPGTIFQFSQSPEDYYKSPLTGTLFRFFRFLCVVISLYLLPAFLTVAGHMPALSLRLSLLDDPGISPVKLLVFVLFAEFGLDLLQDASTHIPQTLVTPLSIIGALVIGEIAIRLDWFSEEVIFYAAVTLLSTLMISYHEFSDALRLYRLVLILGAGAAGLWGLLAATALVVASVVTTPTFHKMSYFWPLVPWNGKAMKSLLFRQPTFRVQKSGHPKPPERA